MNDFEWMSRRTFDENTTGIHAGLKVLMTNPKSRRLFRLTAVYEKNTGELVAEVLRTAFGPVVRYRHRAPNRTGDEYEYRGTRQFRLGHVVEPLIGPDKTFLVASSSCAYQLTGEDFVTQRTDDDRLTFR